MPPRKRRPRGHIRELPSGSFQAIVYAGIDPLTKKERYLRETAPTYGGAEKALTRLQNQVDERRHPRSNITVGELVAKWMEVAELEDSTRERNEDLIRIYIGPTFGAEPAATVDAETLERFYALLGRCREMCNGRRKAGHECRPLANNTIRKVHFILRAAFERGLRWRYLGVNEAALADPPAFDGGRPDPPSAGEVAMLLNEAWADPDWGLFLWLTMLSGSRRGEVCALKWDHVDFDQAILWLEFSRSQTKKGVKGKETKTGQDRRLALDAWTLELLEEHKQRCEERCRQLDVTLAQDAYVFSHSPDGATGLRPRSVSQRYRRLAQRLRLRSTRLHSLRHYSPTKLLAAGVDVRTVSGRLGHASGGTTLKFYAGWVSEADRRAADTIASIVPRPNPTQRQPRAPYEKIAAELRNQIADGRLPTGAKLPTVADLAATNEVAVGTAQRAVALLRSEGLVTVQRGKRAVVSQED